MSDDGIQTLVRQWRSAGVCQGDTLLLHSNVRRTLRECRKSGFKLTPADILQSLLDALGSEGTLLLPLFNFGFSQGQPFDLRHTASQMGVLTEAGRLHPDAVRTGHPIYSFAVIGQHAPAFAGLVNHSGYGADSPFGKLRELGGKVGVLDLPDQHSMTFYHHVEEMLQVDYRYFKTFHGEYTDAAGITQPRDFQLYVRDIERGVKTHVDPAGELMWQAGLYSGSRPRQGSGLRTVLATEMFDFVAQLIRSGQAKNNLYRIDGESSGV